ncbi:MAG: PA14 domain-containing protein [Verrucomicrobiales bacterium]
MLARLTLCLAIATPALAQGVEPTLIEIRTLRGQMKYDLEEFRVEPGAKVRLVLHNDDDMHHNLLICKPGKGNEQEVAKKAWDLGGDGFDKHWIPEHPNLLFASRMADPKGSVTLEFTAPKAPGIYPYVCTLPGHSMLMNGEMLVGEGGSPGGKNGLSELTFTLYKGSWKKLPDFAKLEPVATDHVRGELITLGVAKKLKTHFGVVFNGKLEAPAGGKYSFNINSDDGSRLKINGRDVIDHDGIHANSSKAGSVELTKGSHDLEVQYFEGGGQQELALSWSGPGFKDLPLSSGNRAKKRNQPSGMPIVPPDGEAVIYRNFIEGAGARAIGVGYPMQRNIAYDADQMRLALVWQGAFIDAARHWTGRGQGFQPPLGYNVYQCVEGVPFAHLDSNDSPWPDTARKTSQQRPDNGYVFKGYRLDEKRYPEFRYLFEGEAVTDFCLPVVIEGGGGPRLVRTIHIRGKSDDLYFRAASGDTIERIASGEFVIDGGKARMLLECGSAEPIVRDSAGKQELLIRVPFQDGEATVVQSFLFSH